MSDYIPVTVDAARQVANAFQKHIVVIVSVDHLHDKLHTTTYGRYPEDKIVAAHLGEVLAETAGADMGKLQSFEDFRNLPAAERAAEIETLKELIRGVISRCEAPEIGGYVGRDGQFINKLKAAIIN